MTTQVRQAQVLWHGDLDHGSGLLAQTTSAVLDKQAFTRAARVEAPQGQLSPEELLAAAHAQCCAMGLAHVLSHRGTPATYLQVTSLCHLDLTPHGPRLTGVDLHMVGQVPDTDQEAFTQAAQLAEQRSPLSQVLRASLEVRLTTALENDVWLCPYQLMDE